MRVGVGLVLCAVSMVSGCGSDDVSVYMPDGLREEGCADCSDCADCSSASGGPGSEVPGSTTGGCVGRDFDPLANWTREALPADRVVTTAADSGPGSLRAQLAEAADGEVIGFDSSLAGATISLSQELEVTRSITLDGRGAPGVTLDGAGRTRVLSTAKNRRVRFFGLRFVNGRDSGPGGGVHVRQADENQPESSVEFHGCVFENNAGGRGGALRIGWRVNAVVADCVFRDNDGTIGAGDDPGFSGGAISTSQDASEGLQVLRSRFEDNIGTVSGAVYNILQPLQVLDSVFLNNEATRGAGAVFTDGGNTVGPRNDPATGEEGEITLARLWMEGNEGRGEGGAMMLWGYPRDRMTLQDLVVIDSVVHTGGQFDNSKGGGARLHALDDLEIRNSVFARNRSTQQGGALWIDGTGDVEIINSTFSDNHVENDTGGAFTYNGREGTIRIESSAFVDNFAGRACGAFWWASGDQDIEVKNSIFARNQVPRDLAQRHVREPRPTDGGGNLEFVESDPGRGRIFDGSAFADPMLEPLGPMGCTLGHALMNESPARDTGVSSSIERDAQGQERKDPPDIGPFEAD